MKRSKQQKSPRRRGRLTSPWRPWLWGAGLVLLVTITYWPTLDNGLVSDDTTHIEENVALESLEGLLNIWFKLGTTPQYYPLVFSTFWVEYHWWGLDPRGYHIVNLLLHAAASVLVWRLLVRLAVPGAWLAAAIFAVHPVSVESVAWVSERKNLLSCVLALGSLLAYLRFSPPEDPAQLDATSRAARGGWRYYGLALGLYVAALFSKTVTASVPAVLLVIYWWKRGRVTWRDAVGTVPFFAVGLASSAITVWMEKTYCLAEGAEWDLSFVERSLIAGRALWFYAGKLLWPHPLVFFYPRWVIDARLWWQYLFPAAALSLIVVLWLARTRIGRGQLAAVLIFAGVLTPALGFFNVYPFRYSFVADHYQYHASIALLALAAAGAVLVRDRLANQARRLAPLAGAGLLFTLAVVTQQRTHVYKDQSALDEDIVARDPQSWVAHYNLGVGFRKQEKYDEAIAHFRKAIEIRENQVRDHPTVSAYRDELARGYVDLALSQQQMGRPADAAASHRKALEIREKLVQDRPAVTQYQIDAAASYVDLGLLARDMGQGAEAESAFRKAIEIRDRLARDNPAVNQYKNNLAANYVDLGILQRDMGRPAEAESAFQKAIEIRENQVRDHSTVSPNQDELARGYVNLALAQQRTGRPADAAASYRKAIAIREKLAQDSPTVSKYQIDAAASYADVGLLEREMGREAEAESAFRKAIEICDQLARDNPAISQYKNNVAANYVDLGILKRDRGRPAEAETAFQKAIEIRERLLGDHPNASDYQDGLAWCYVGLGLAQQKTARPAEAEVSYRKAIEIREKLARDNPTISDYQNNVATSYVDLGILQRDRGRPADAVTSCQKAVQIREKLVLDHPTVTDYRAGLGWSYANLGVAHLASGQSAEAVPACKKALEVRKKLVLDHPTATNYQALGWSYANLGVAQSDSGQFADAEVSHRKAINVRAKLVQDNPTVDDYRHEIALSCRDLGNLQRIMGRVAEAVASYRAAIEIHEKLAADYPTNAASQLNLANDLASCGEALAMLGEWSESADVYVKAVRASNHSWQTIWPCAMVQLAAGNESGYRATCAELVTRYGTRAAPDAAFPMALTLVVGENALADMNQALAIAKRAADADPSDPIAAILVGAAEYRAGRGEQAIATLTKALAQLESASADKPDRIVVGRLVGEVILALAYHEQTSRETLQKQLETLQNVIDTSEAPGPQTPGSLPPWAVGFVVEIATRELAKLSVPTEANQ